MSNLGQALASLTDETVIDGEVLAVGRVWVAFPLRLAEPRISPGADHPMCWATNADIPIAVHACVHRDRKTQNSVSLFLSTVPKYLAESLALSVRLRAAIPARRRWPGMTLELSTGGRELAPYKRRSRKLPCGGRTKQINRNIRQLASRARWRYRPG
jgi:hypothetical protein